MDFLRNLLRRKRPTAASSSKLPRSSERPAPVKAEQSKGADYSFVRDQTGKVHGIWLRDPQDTQKRELFMVLAIKHSLPTEILGVVMLGDYRVVPNTFDGAGGCFVMFGSALAPGEIIPSLEAFIWRKGEENPVGQDVSISGEPIEGKQLRYLCPACKLPVWVERSKIVPVIGLNVQCANCKNISHVPGAFGSGALPPNLKITGGVIVPIKQFSEWYFHHPVVKSLLNEKQTELLSSYGLWGYCRKCFHQYRSTVLSMLPVYQEINSGQTSFLACLRQLDCDYATPTYRRRLHVPLCDRMTSANDSATQQV